MIFNSKFYKYYYKYRFKAIFLLCIITITCAAFIKWPLYTQNDCKNFSQALPVQDKTANFININTATKAELCNLNGIGETKAKAIILYRQQNGNFKTIQEIKNVSGIGDKLYFDIKNYICI